MIQSVSSLYTFAIYWLTKKMMHYINKSFFFCQLATGGIRSAVYEKLIAPFKNDLPASHMDCIRRVCADKKYAYFGPSVWNKEYSYSLSCSVVPLPETSYSVQWALTISKNSSYKSLINWRWDNKMKSSRYITDKWRLSCDFRKSLNPEGHVCLLLGIRA